VDLRKDLLELFKYYRTRKKLNFVWKNPQKMFLPPLPSIIYMLIMKKLLPPPSIIQKSITSQSLKVSSKNKVYYNIVIDRELIVNKIFQNLRKLLFPTSALPYVISTFSLLN